MSVNLAERTHLDEMVDAAAERLLALQNPAGFWWGLLETNVCMEAEYVLLAHCLDKRDRGREEQILRHMLHTQGADGAWAIFPGGPGDLNATVEAYQALKLIGLRADEEPLARARAFILANGGAGATRVFTRLWLALVGQFAWDELPVVPPELILLPDFLPLNIYDFACWARQTVVPLSIVLSHRPLFPVPESAAIPELFCAAAPDRKRLSGWERFFHAADRALHAYTKFSVQPGRAIAERCAIRWVVDHQEEDGSWGGIQPPWFYSLLALKVMGLTEHPAFVRGWEGLESFGVRAEGGRWWFQACVSPVWDTALAILALRAAGLPPECPALVEAAGWLCEQQVLTGGDWQHARPQARPGGWAFEFANRRYPDVDDTAVVLLALNQVKMPQEAVRRRALTAGFRWLAAMQCKNGGWAAFDADNTRNWATLIPFSDFGWVVDPPTEDVTGHALECFGGFGYGTAWSVVRAGVEFLRRAQKPDGSWMGRWGVNYIYGTGAALPGLAAAGTDMREPWIQRALDFLEACQNPDGGWGETCASYQDESQKGRGPSTPSQTAWALIGLIAGGRAGGAAAARGVEHLRRTQRPDGGWDEAHYTGTGFPGDFFIGYHLYRDVFPLLALGRCRDALRRSPS